MLYQTNEDDLPEDFLMDVVELEGILLVTYDVVRSAMAVGGWWGYKYKDMETQKYA